MASTKSKEWTRAIMCRPRDNLTTEAGLRAQHHVMVSRLDQEVINRMRMIELALITKLITLPVLTRLDVNAYWHGVRAHMVKGSGPLSEEAQ